MPLSMHEASAPVFIQGLKGLASVLRKAAAHAETKGFDPAALLQARLYPDMFPLTRQVQICADFAKGAVARLAGEDPPAWADDETSFEDLIARVEKTVAYVGQFPAARIDGSEDRNITLVRRGESSVVKGKAYLLEQATPNLFSPNHGLRDPAAQWRRGREEGLSWNDVRFAVTACDGGLLSARARPRSNRRPRPRKRPLRTLDG